MSKKQPVTEAELKIKPAIKKKVLVICSNCGKKFYRYKGDIAWNIKRGDTNYYCSKKCYYESLKGSDYSELIALRKSARMVRWRKKIFKRDHYTCQMCHKKGGQLNAHHIKRFIDYPEGRFDTLNGITLCVKCHKKTFFKEKKFEKKFLEIAKKNHEKEKRLRNGT